MATAVTAAVGGTLVKGLSSAAASVAMKTLKKAVLNPDVQDFSLGIVRGRARRFARSKTFRRSRARPLVRRVGKYARRNKSYRRLRRRARRYS